MSFNLGIGNVPTDVCGVHLSSPSPVWYSAPRNLGTSHFLCLTSTSVWWQSTPQNMLQHRISENVALCKQGFCKPPSPIDDKGLTSLKKHCTSSEEPIKHICINEGMEEYVLRIVMHDVSFFPPEIL